MPMPRIKVSTIGAIDGEEYCRKGGGGGLVGAYVFCIKRSGRMIPDEKIAPADFAVP